MSEHVPAPTENLTADHLADVATAADMVDPTVLVTAVMNTEAAKLALVSRAVNAGEYFLLLQTLAIKLRDDLGVSPLALLAALAEALERLPPREAQHDVN